jgi:hypothetical protein
MRSQILLHISDCAADSDVSRITSAHMKKPTHKRVISTGLHGRPGGIYMD